MVRVTEVLGILKYGEIPNHRLELAREVGVLVHRHVLTTLAGYYLPPPHPYIKQYVDKTLRWCDMMIEEVMGVEIEVKDTAFGIVGHIDLPARLKGYKTPFILDLKRVSNLQWATKLQLGAYHHMAEIKWRRKFRRAAVHIPAQGEIKLWEPSGKPEEDWAIFLNLLNVYNFSKRG